MTRSSDRRQRFVAAYRRDGDATGAAIAAGFAPRLAAATAQRLLQREDVRAALAEDEKAEEPQARLEDLTRELLYIATADPCDLVDSAGRPRPLGELPIGLRRAIASLEITEKPNGERVHKVRFWSKSAALEGLAKLLGGHRPSAAAEASQEERALSDKDIIQRVLALAAERSAAGTGDADQSGHARTSVASAGE